MCTVGAGVEMAGEKRVLIDKAIRVDALNETDKNACIQSCQTYTKEVA